MNPEEILRDIYKRAVATTCFGIYHVSHLQIQVVLPV